MIAAEEGLLESSRHSLSASLEGTSVTVLKRFFFSQNTVQVSFPLSS